MTIRPRRFDLIVFDWDGTLFDSTALIVRCIQRACTDIGVAPPSDERAAFVIGLGLRDALEYAVPGLPVERYPALGERYRHHYFAGQHDVTLFAGTRAMLDDLQRGDHRLAVATGKNRRGLDEALSLSGLDAVFHATRTADETASKPDPTMLLELMQALGTAPERTLMIGDTTHDLQLAANAGTAALAVAYGAHEAAAFEPFAPLYVAASTGQLHAWLRAHA
jgi:phosphoglycolate phosphatase